MLIKKEQKMASFCSAIRGIVPKKMRREKDIPPMSYPPQKEILVLWIIREDLSAPDFIFYFFLSLIRDYSKAKQNEFGEKKLYFPPLTLARR